MCRDYDFARTDLRPAKPTISSVFFKFHVVGIVSGVFIACSGWILVYKASDV